MEGFELSQFKKIKTTAEDASLLLAGALVIFSY